ncbi:MAG: metal-sensitive transcriptional regulator [Anaerolineae bacterium]|nr:MAG: metal-sensitive transcriptional regulator [Anaerolineae bacterium]
MEHHNHTNVVNRLKSVSGHINGIITMLEEDRYCIDIIKQIQATQAALARVSELILENHLDTCLTTAIRGDDPNERERVLAEVMEVFRTENRTK